ncbi:MAG: hypothetical protein A2284_13480 [Deltaproteobacteria bacterium RIFOXYA12_FULL_61_11]|nr:MAG: hypothetical protein A2284_13480 [Deltaproteobacteria bacterium RIFOXYA12_FULL_61_11]
MNMAQRLALFLLRRRTYVLLLITVLTVFFGWKTLHLRVDSPIIDLFPSDHPFVETFIGYKDIFGGASTVMIQVEVDEGDIFRKEVLQAIQRITRALELLPGINNYQVLSIAQRKVKRLDVDEHRGFLATPIMWPEIPESEAELAAVREQLVSSPRYYGTLVSEDLRAALILAGFFEDRLDVPLVYAELEKIVTAETNEHLHLSMIGRPVMLGWILQQYPQVQRLFLYTLLAIVLVLVLYFRDLRGVLVPLCTAAVSALWGLGFLALLDCNFDPLVIVVPFIISARALSHSVQLVERYLEEFRKHGDRDRAAVATFKGLFTPGLVSILTDAIGVALVLLTPIPLLQKLALLGSFWVLSILVSDLILNPLLLSILPPPSRAVSKNTIFDRLHGAIAGVSRGRSRYVVLTVTSVLLIGGYYFASNLEVGDVHPGTPLLWPDSPYNRATAAIAERFGKTELLSVVVEGETREAIKDPRVLLTMEAFQRHMERLPEVTGTSSLADLLPGIIATLHGGFPKWELVPDDPAESGFYLEMIYSSSEPGDLGRFVTIDSQNANITLYLRDHRGETLRKVIAAAQDFIGTHTLEKARFRLAGGFGGLLAAVNEVITWHQAKITVLAFSIVFLFCGLAYRSIVAGLLFMVPLILSNYLTYALMGARGIGLDINALPVVALGVGLGVDYGLYIVDRIKEEYQRCADLDLAVSVALRTAGKAVTFTAATMVAGVAFWNFSFLRFQAEMGFLLVFWMVVSMLGALFLLPALITLFRPSFITRSAIR